MINKNLINRRSFLKGASALAAFSIVPRHVLGGPGYLAPSEQLNRAVIGVGGMGQGHLRYQGGKLLAICDVDTDRLASTKKKCGPEVKTYTDYREVLDRPDIDYVQIPTPPHWHAKISIDAARAGKDIWCEKPMARTIGEGKKVVQAVQENG
ncbi:MAG: Gfo/Idh/MocA family oxidoreductase, partial [Anaerohalosphaera sp.]|nr:Gfo/Idh/MocA family oxidoreductase [Anaerohalosphaera sp.]